jgi:hypothetical protein
MLNPRLLGELDYWMQERQKIHDLKETGAIRPWTDDPILQTFKFCNVKREDDKVTKWFASNWRGPQYWGEVNFIPAIMLGRTINWPETLEYIGFPDVWDPISYCQRLDNYQAKGKKVYTGAYMITAGPPGVRKNLWVTGNANTYFTRPPKLDSNSIENSWYSIINGKYPCVGPFIAGQIIADLKQTPVLMHAKDWWDWAALGPGSARGLNRLHGRPLTDLIPQQKGLKEMKEVKDQLGRDDLCLQDVQNCLCEFDKWQRVKLRQGKPRSGYPGK